MVKYDHKIKQCTVNRISEISITDLLRPLYCNSCKSLLLLCTLPFYAAGDFSGAVETLKTAISLIKQSITASAESSVVSWAGRLAFSWSWQLSMRCLELLLCLSIFTHISLNSYLLLAFLVLSSPFGICIVPVFWL